jgi:hypothetical protein
VHIERLFKYGLHLCTASTVADPDPYVFRPPGSVSQRYGSADPDPYQNVTDLQHCVQDNEIVSVGDESSLPTLPLFFMNMCCFVSVLDDKVLIVGGRSS